MDSTGWESLVGKIVVIDTDSRFVYIGTLDKVEAEFLVMKDVDAHDRREGPSTKEQYVMDTKKFGVKANRKELHVRKSLVVSLSKLEDIVDF